MKRLLTIFCLLSMVVLLFSACPQKTSIDPGSNNNSNNSNNSNEAPSTPEGQDMETPVNPIPMTNLVITRPRNADDLIINVSEALGRAVGEKANSGAIKPKTDSMQRNVSEILIGNTNRAETTAAKALLDGKVNAFAIYRSGNKLAVVGTTDEMTCYGVEYLIREIVPTCVSKDSVGLAEDYSYIETSETLDLATNGKNNFRISFASVANTKAVREDVIAIRSAIKTATGSQPTYYEDSEAQSASRDAAVKEILVGSTYHSETYTAFSKLAYSEGVVAIEGNKIIVFGFTESALNAATELFCQLVANHTSGKNVVFPQKLFLRVKDDSLSEVSAPIYHAPIQSVVSVDGGAMVYLPGTTLTEFNAYAQDLQGKGYSAFSTNTLGTSEFYTYTKDRAVINGGFDPEAGIARVIIETSTAPKLPILDFAFNKATDSICEPLLTQVDLNNLDVQSGMSYVIRLRDGRFIIIDGGAKDYDESKQLYDLLKAQNVRDGKPTIAAWFLTHAHGDHYQAFLEMSNTYAESLTIESVVVNLGTQDLLSKTFGSEIKGEIYSAINRISGVKKIYARTGQKFRFADVEIDVWNTPEDLYKGAAGAGSGNDLSVIYRMTCDGQTTMFLADAETGIATAMVNRYGDALKSDIMQISHHGYTYSYLNVDNMMVNLFAKVDPDVVLWPAAELWYHYFTDSNNTNHANHDLVARVKAKNGEIIASCFGTRVLTLPYAAQAMVQHSYNDGDVIYSQDFESVKNLYEVGWQLSDDLNGTYVTPKTSIQYSGSDKGIQMESTKDFSTITFLPRDYLENVNTYTVTMDLNITSLGNGVWIWYHDSEPQTASSTRDLYQINRADKFTLKLVITREQGGKTVAYINGNQVGTYNNESANLGALIFRMGNNAKVFVGSVTVVAGAN